MLIKAVTEIDTEFGRGKLHAYHFHEGEYVTLVVGNVSDGHAVLTRLHDQCLTADVFHSDRCDCRQQRLDALRLIGSAGRGIFIHTPMEGRGQGLVAKIQQYAAQTSLHLDTIQAARHLGYPDDSRDYSRIPIILADIGVKTIRLLTNNPLKIAQLRSLGVHIVEILPLSVSNLSERATQYVEVKTKWQRVAFSDDNG